MNDLNKKLNEAAKKQSEMDKNQSNQEAQYKYNLAKDKENDVAKNEIKETVIDNSANSINTDNTFTKKEESTISTNFSENLKNASAMDIFIKGIVGSMLTEKKVVDDKNADNIKPLKEDTIKETVLKTNEKLNIDETKLQENVNKIKEDNTIKETIIVQERKLKEDEIKPMKEDTIKETTKVNRDKNIGEPFSDTSFNPKLNVSLNKETLEKRIDNKSMKDLLKELNKENLSDKHKETFLNQIMAASKEHEQKYNIKLLEEPRAKNINDQVNAIMNSNLKELGDTRALKVYQTLNKDGKALNGRPELETEIKNNIKSIIEGYNKGTLNENTNGFKIAFKGDDPYRKVPENLMKNADGAPTKAQLDWLNNNIKENDFNKNIEKFLKEDQHIFRDSVKKTMNEYKDLNNTIELSEKLAKEGKFSQENVQLLKETRDAMKPELEKIVNKRLDAIGFDLNANIENERKLKEAADIEKDKYGVNQHKFTEQDINDLYR